MSNVFWYIDDDGTSYRFRTLFDCKLKFFDIVLHDSKPSRWDGTQLVHYDSKKGELLSTVVCSVFTRSYKDELGFDKEILSKVRFSRSLKV